MTLEDLGYNNDLEEFRRKENLDSFGVGRVISEHKDRYEVKTDEKVYNCEIIGQLRFSSQSRADFPVVGDWVAISEYDDNKALIHAVLPRKTSIERQAVGKKGEKQIIASNIDYAFVIQAVDRDFNINRLERYLTICYTSNVEPIILLNKIDLISADKLESLINTLKERIKNTAIIAISNESKIGLEELSNKIKKGKTYCLLGSSGVGKSTLVNNLSGEQIMETNSISNSNFKGRHVTTHRELIVLENGGILIDNPGMREVGITNSSLGIEETFDTISTLSKNCKFKNCTHTSEVGCAVIEGVEEGEINRSEYENFLKIAREKEHFESTLAERRKKDKDFGKMIKQVKNDSLYRK